MSSQKLEDIKQNLDEYRIVSDKILNILNTGKDALESGAYNETIEKEVFSKIKQFGPIASKVIGNIIAYHNYHKFFRASFSSLKFLLEENIKGKQAGNKDGIVDLLCEVGEQGYDLLCYIFLNDENEHRKLNAAIGLAKLGNKGVNFLQNTLSESNTQTQAIAANAMARIVSNYFSEHNYEKENSLLTETDIEDIVIFLQENVSHSNDHVRIICMLVVLEIKRLDSKIIESAIEDKNPNVRDNVLRGILRNGIGKREAKAFVIAFEDPIKEISNLALNRLDESFIKNPEAVMSSIIDELIIRESGRPKEFFNTKLSSDAIKKIAELNPRLMGKTLHKLRDIAFQYHDQTVMSRCIFVAQKLNQKEFVALVGERAESSPEITQKILKAIDSGLITNSPPNLVNSEYYIDPNRIFELKSVTSAQFDLVKLIRLSEELNNSYKNNNYLSVIMLVRTILDHTPPIFGFKTFIEVASHYGGKSIKKSLQNLQNSSRNIADAHLHEPIRSKETLPNKTQVDFRNDLDVLLSEIVRLLK